MPQPGNERFPGLIVPAPNGDARLSQVDRDERNCSDLENRNDHHSTFDREVQPFGFPTCSDSPEGTQRFRI
jgi:hypothetical protein